ncbi:hypothetical protein [Pararhizobium qamdonense]|uniref:hypothetical protein n=1 Tax=Pararhizobium qamdonense TaxID=3031126 RepID=UPI0023E28D41|nr:hypothetical protein [Pararhizobium qamdonense]
MSIMIPGLDCAPRVTGLGFKRLWRASSEMASGDLTAVSTACSKGHGDLCEEKQENHGPWPME